MLDLDRLEKLKGLLDDGALSQEEFEQQKAELLNKGIAPQSRFPPRALLIASALATIAAFIGGVIWVRSVTSPAKNEPATGVRSGKPATPTVKPSHKADGPSDDGQDQGSSLSFAISRKAIGLNPEYLEERLGTPREKSKLSLVFDVGGCEVHYSTDGESINGIQVDVTGSCNPIIDGRRINQRTNFGQLMRRDKSGKFVATCLAGCGNAADPSIQYSYRANHSNQFIEVTYSTSYDQAARALEAWDKSLRESLGIGAYEMPVDYEPFSCVENPPAAIHHDLQRMTVQSIYIPCLSG